MYIQKKSRKILAQYTIWALEGQLLTKLTPLEKTLKQPAICGGKKKRERGELRAQ